MSFHSVIGFAVAVIFVGISLQIEAQPFSTKPTVNFALYSPCANTITIFEDHSNFPENQILERFWDLGDGSPVQKGKRVSHSYPNSGQYEVSLSLRFDNQEILQSRKTISIANSILPPIPYPGTVCYNQSAQLKAALPDQSAAVIQWFQNQDDVNAFHQGGFYQTPPLQHSARYYLESRNPDGCRSSRVEIEARVLSVPDVQIIVQPESLSLPVAEAAFAVASNKPIESWDWDFGDQGTDFSPNPVHEYREAGNFQVKVRLTDENGCTYQLTQNIQVDRNSEILIPSAFSPNGDGVNDWFRISHYQLRQFQIEIRDSQGRKVFNSLDPNFRWDGTDIQGRTLAEGEYGLYVNARSADGQPIIQKQTIILIR